MPILIAEKMGPHFAVGDTCYSTYDEEVNVYNPDGKEIVARDNEVAALRSGIRPRHILTVIRTLPFLMMNWQS